jgi:predicted Holliday junction resolvase-like endonuclease
MSVTLITILILIVLFLGTLVLLICQRNKNKELKNKLDLKTEAYLQLKEEFDLYRQSEQYRIEKQKEANEKIDDLHSGKLSADDILPKR